MAHSGIAPAKLIIKQLEEQGEELSLSDKIAIISLLTQMTYKGHNDVIEILTQIEDKTKLN